MGSRGKLKPIKIQGGTKLFPSLERPYPGPRSRLDSSVFLRPSCTRSLADNTSYVSAQWDGEILPGGEIDLNFVSRDFCNCWEHIPSMVRWVLLNYRYGGDTGGDARKGVEIRQPRGSAGWKVSWISFHRANNLHQTPVYTWILFHPSWASLPIQHLTHWQILHCHSCINSLSNTDQDFQPIVRRKQGRRAEERRAKEIISL